MQAAAAKVMPDATKARAYAKQTKRKPKPSARDT
jgi:hypothetical protein